MKILGVGLSKTGTVSLHAALRILGFSSLHYDEVRLTRVLDGSDSSPSFRVYDDVDAVVDLPAAYFYDELREAYPDCRCILTVRNVDDWWRSVARHFNERHPITTSGANGEPALNEAMPAEEARFRTLVRNYVYGSTTAHEFLYKKKFREHNERVVRTIPPDRLLVMDITAGDGWSQLCPFLGVRAPFRRFPHKNRSKWSIRS